MTANLDFDRQLTAWLDAAWPSDVAPEVVDAALHEARSMGRPGRVIRLATGPSAWPAVGELWILGRRRSLASAGVALLLVTALVAGALWAGSRLPLPPSLVPLRGVLTPAGNVPIGIATLDFGAAVLSDGRVIAQGEDTSLITWDEPSATFRSIGVSNVWRQQSHLFPLPDGRLAIVGGDLRRIDATSGEAAASTLEIFDPARGTSSATVQMNEPRWAEGAIRLDDGRILAVGGLEPGDSGITSDAIELYDPATAEWRDAGRLTKARVDPSMLELADGRVLVVGGTNNVGENVEVYDPSAGRVTTTIALPTMILPDAMVIGLTGGRVLVGGGGCREIEEPGATGHSSGTLARPTLYFDPTSSSLSPGPDLPHCATSLTPLAGGEVFATGWWFDGSGPLRPNGRTKTLVTWGGLLDPNTGTVRTTGAPAGHYVRAVALHDGRALLFVTSEGVGDPTLEGVVAELLD